MQGSWLLALGSWLLALGSWLLALGSWLLRKNSGFGFDFVLKGRGFGRAVSAAKSTPALASEGALSLQCHFFRSLLGSWLQSSKTRP
jgi:hypothetical protein